MNILYIPKVAVTPQNAEAYVNGNYVNLDFRITTPSMDHDVKRNIQRSLSGRPCVFAERETVSLKVTAKNISIKDKPKWVEFSRSTKNGEVVLVNTKGLPVDCWVASEEAVVMGVPAFNTVDKFTFDVSFTLEWWELRN